MLVMLLQSYIPMFRWEDEEHQAELMSTNANAPRPVKSLIRYVTT